MPCVCLNRHCKTSIALYMPTEILNAVQPSVQTVSTRSAWRTMLVLATLLLVIYAWFPTRNHYWDGIGFALNIEGLGEDRQGVVRNQGDFKGISSIYFNPNHLFYNLIGHLIYKPLHTVFPKLRAHDMLRGISSLLSVGTACLLFLALFRWCKDSRLSLFLTLLMALSATWWKFSTDANAYVPSAFLLMLATFQLTNPTRRPSGWQVGLLHALSMLLHQVSIFFLPAAVVGLWIHSCNQGRQEKKRAVLWYLLAAGIPVAAAYAWVWFGLLGEGLSSERFIAWLTSNGGDTFAFKSIGANALESLRSLLRVFFGGRIKLALAFVEFPILVALGCVMFSSLLWLLWSLRQHVGAVNLSQSSREPLPPAMKFLAVWAGVFTVFLFVWLTEYSYYRLFYLPAVIFLIGVGVVRLGGQATTILGAIVVFMATFNFTAYIYPYAQDAATPPVRLAKDAAAFWTGDVVVLYKDFTCDNWIMRYFNPDTVWIQADLSNQETFNAYLQSAKVRNQQVWVDTTLLGHLKYKPEIHDWLLDYGKISKPFGLVSKKHHIQFVQVVAHNASSD